VTVRPGIEYIENLVARNPDQMKAAEYRIIAETITSKCPCNLLVFGVGNDSELWYLSNPGGTTLFVEDCQDWIDQVRRQFSRHALEIYRHEYCTRLTEASNLLWPARRVTSVPAPLRRVVWDVIIVDGPMGHRKDDPGRVQPIAWAGRMARASSRPVDIFVHDIHRPTEFLACARFLGAGRQRGEVGHLAHFRFAPADKAHPLADSMRFLFRFGAIVVPRAWRALAGGSTRRGPDIRDGG
jgi:uncharacterized protein (TIGR01627 family)